MINKKKVMRTGGGVVLFLTPLAVPGSLLSRGGAHAFYQQQPGMGL